MAKDGKKKSDKLSKEERLAVKNFLVYYSAELGYPYHYFAETIGRKEDVIIRFIENMTGFSRKTAIKLAEAVELTFEELISHSQSGYFKSPKAEIIPEYPQPQFNAMLVKISNGHVLQLEYDIGIDRALVFLAEDDLRDHASIMAAVVKNACYLNPIFYGYLASLIMHIRSNGGPSSEEIQKNGHAAKILCRLQKISNGHILCIEQLGITNAMIFMSEDELVSHDSVLKAIKEKCFWIDPIFHSMVVIGIQSASAGQE